MDCKNGRIEITDKLASKLATIVFENGPLYFNNVLLIGCGNSKILDELCIEVRNKKQSMKSNTHLATAIISR